MLCDGINRIKVYVANCPSVLSALLPACFVFFLVLGCDEDVASSVRIVMVRVKMADFLFRQIVVLDFCNLILSLELKSRNYPCSIRI